jgi:transposase
MTTNLEPNKFGTSADPEVLDKPKRRRFTREKKMEILDEIDKAPGDTGLILRREGIYSSHLYQWRRWRETMGAVDPKEKHNELAKANRRIVSLELKLKKAETIIDLQKKISQLMDLEQERPTESA